MVNIESIKLTHEIVQLIASIDEFKGYWRNQHLLDNERLKLLRAKATVESVGASTRIEGSKLTDNAVRKLISNINPKKLPTRDQQEVAGYAQAMETVLESWKEIQLTENIIKQLHRDLLKHSVKDQRHLGDYKKFSNSVGVLNAKGEVLAVVFETATPFDTPRLMQEIVARTNHALTTKEIHPLLAIGLFIVVFLQIHPFQDGNGRSSRILTSLLLLRAGYSYVPYSSAEKIFEQNKKEYFAALRRTQTSFKTENLDWTPWLTFFLKSLLQQCKNLNKVIDEEKDLYAKLPKLSAQIMEYVFHHGRATMSDIIIDTGANRNTISKHLKELLQKKLLIKHGQLKGSWYQMQSK